MVSGSVAPAYLCHLSDCTVCEVTEERNGIFELYLQIPTGSEQFASIVTDCLIGAKPNDTMDAQYFRVYAVEKSMGGLAAVSAEHISYLLVSCPVDTAVQIAGTANDCINLVLSRAAALTPGGIPFTGYSDIETMYGADFRAVSAREALTGIQSLFGGEFLWDNFAVRLLQHRGQDRGVRIAYRKNLTGLKCTTSTAASYTALYPFYKTDLELISLPEGTLAVPNNSGINERVLLLDLTEALSSTAEAHDAAVSALASAALLSCLGGKSRCIYAVWNE
jgi:phage minor structural protein